MKNKRSGRNNFLRLFLAGLFLMFIASPNVSWADSEVDALKEQLGQLSEMMQNVEKKLADMEAKNTEKEAEIEEMEERVSEAELHTATDKLSLGIELRSRGDSIHYQDMISAPDALMGMFFTPAASGGLNGLTKSQIQQAMPGLATSPLVCARFSVSLIC